MATWMHMASSLWLGRAGRWLVRAGCDATSQDVMVLDQIDVYKVPCQSCESRKALLMVKLRYNIDDALVAVSHI